MKNAIELTNDGLPKLLIKYAIIIVILELITRFAIVHILRFYQNTFSSVDNADYSTIENLNNVVRAVIVIILNITIGFILLLDLDRRKSLTWVLFGLTLLNPWMSVIFFLIWKVAEMKNYAQHRV
jgi:hypothetical protein